MAGETKGLPPQENLGVTRVSLGRAARGRFGTPGGGAVCLSCPSKPRVQIDLDQTLAEWPCPGLTCPSGQPKATVLGPLAVGPGQRVGNKHPVAWAFQLDGGTQRVSPSPRAGWDRTAQGGSGGRQADGGHTLFREQNPMNGHLSEGRCALWMFLEWL